MILPFLTTHCVTTPCSSIGLRCLRLGLLKGHGTGALPCWHLSARRPRGTVGATVSLCQFLFTKNAVTHATKGASRDKPFGIRSICHVQKKVVMLCMSVRSTCNHLQVSAVHDQPPPEPEGTIFEMATLVSLHKLCKQHSILVDSCCRNMSKPHLDKAL